MTRDASCESLMKIFCYRPECDTYEGSQSDAIKLENIVKTFTTSDISRNTKMCVLISHLICESLVKFNSADIYLFYVIFFGLLCSNPMFPLFLQLPEKRS